MPPARVPVLLVAGPRGAGKTSLLRRWLADKPPAERWAVLVNDFGVERLVAPQGDGVGVFELAGGCACCTASVVMRATLARVLRSGPWVRVLVELSAQANPAAVVDALREGLLAAAIEVEGTVTVVDAASGAGAAPMATRARTVDGAEAAAVVGPIAGPATARSALAAADVVVLGGARGAALGPSATATAAVRDALGTGPLGPRPVLDLDGASWRRVREALIAPVRPVDAHLAGGGGRWSRDDPEGPALEWRWPPEAKFDRLALRRWCAAVRARPEVARARGVFRTEREWYRWTWSGGVETWAPTAWRRDNRAECTMRAPDEGAIAGPSDASGPMGAPDAVGGADAAGAAAAAVTPDAAAASLEAGLLAALAQV